MSDWTVSHCSTEDRVRRSEREESDREDGLERSVVPSKRDGVARRDLVVRSGGSLRWSQVGQAASTVEGSNERGSEGRVSQRRSLSLRDRESDSRGSLRNTQARRRRTLLTRRLSFDEEGILSWSRNRSRGSDIGRQGEGRERR